MVLLTTPDPLSPRLSSGGPEASTVLCPSQGPSLGEATLNCLGSLSSYLAGLLRLSTLSGSCQVLCKVATSELLCR